MIGLKRVAKYIRFIFFIAIASLLSVFGQGIANKYSTTSHIPGTTPIAHADAPTDTSDDGDDCDGGGDCDT